MKNESQNASALPQSRTRSILSWILAVILLLIGLGLLGSNIFVGLLMIAVAASFVPALKMKLQQRIKRLGIVQGVSIFVLLVAAAATMPSAPTTEQPVADTPTVEQPAIETSAQNEQTNDRDVNPTENTETPSDSNTVSNTDTEQVTENSDNTATSDTTPEPAPAQEVTVSQKNAVQKAKSYLAYTAFSYSGLISQLEYEGYSTADATYGADNSGADWYEQAAKKAEDYMNYSAFSRSGLISQLEYDGFTQPQAEHGADDVGL